MTLDPKVFKAYDIRGLYPSELDEEGAYAVGRAYAEEFEPAAIAIGRDMRLSSPTMAEAVARGVSDAGVDVVDVGMIGTEMLYFAVGSLALDGGVTVTASHNPKEYTGMKIVRRGALPVGGDSGLQAVRSRAERGFGQGPPRAGCCPGGGHLPGLGGRGAVVRRPERDRAAQRRDRRRERDGGTDAAATPRAPPGRRRAVLLRA